MNKVSSALCSLREIFYRQKYKKESQQLKRILTKNHNSIPVLLVCYNNGVYVRNITNRLNDYQITPIVLDNASEDEDTRTTLEFLQSNGSAHVIKLDKNLRHKVAFLPAFYDQLPDVFAYSDPDLELSRNMPPDFLQRLANLTSQFEVFKAGLALDIPDNVELISNVYKKSKCKPIRFEKSYSVLQWESKFWKRPLKHEEFNVYAAPIDTTFAVYNKKHYHGDFFDAVRVGGEFAAIHMPWFPAYELMTREKKSLYLENNKSSTWVS